MRRTLQTSRSWRAIGVGVALALVLVLVGVGGGPHIEAATGPSGEFVPLSPTRVLDTRSSPAPSGPVLASSVVDLQVAGAGGVPASDVSAVALSVTIQGPGHVTAWPTGEPMPATSNVNGVQATSWAPPGPPSYLPATNLVVVRVGAGGKVSFFRAVRYAAVIVDVVGWFPTGSSLTATSPQRLLDTRSTPGSQLQPGAVRTIPVAGRAGLPASGVGAVVLNVTAVGPLTDTHLTIWPADQPRPVASSLNISGGDVAANLVIIPLSSSGEIAVEISHSAVDLIVDVFGWFPTGSDFTALTPTRLVDTRTGLGGHQGTLAPCTYIDVDVAGHGGVPASGVGAVALNVTVVNPTRSTYLTVWPSGTTAPLASNVTAGRPQTTATAVIAAVGAAGNVSILNYAGDADLVVDIAGWFPVPPGGVPPAAPTETSACERSAGQSTLTDVSPDGRYVVFRSTSENLVDGDHNDRPDLFVKDRNTDTLRRAAIDAGQSGAVLEGHISDDGTRLLVLLNESYGPVPGARELYLVDLSTQQRIDVPIGLVDTTNGITAANLSGDGEVVAFATWSAPFAGVGGHAYLWNRVTGGLVDAGPDTTPSGSGRLALSADGRLLAHLRPVGPSYLAEPVVFDSSTGLSEVEATAGNMPGVVDLSADGSRVLFGTTFGAPLTLRNRPTGAATSVPPAPGYYLLGGSLSRDGTMVAFNEVPSAYATGPVATSTHARWNLTSGATSRLDDNEQNQGGAAVVANNGDLFFTRAGQAVVWPDGAAGLSTLSTPTPGVFPKKLS